VEPEVTHRFQHLQPWAVVVAQAFKVAELEITAAPGVVAAALVHLGREVMLVQMVLGMCLAAELGKAAVVVAALVL
jgi:hypothetical protein